uniref:Uncharacterized protein n=1 Tax=Bos indicus x Bos taurus TaxID=30522 RepID=A0A4W2HSQ4_BOBOX
VMLSTFSCTHFPSVCPLWKNILCLFLNWMFVLLLIHMTSLCILDINPLTYMTANVFFHLVGCLLILLMVSFAEQKLFSLI